MDKFGDDALDLLQRSLTSKKAAAEALLHLYPLTANLVSKYVADASSIYVIGHSHSFSKFTVPLLSSLGSRLAGVSCFGTAPMKYPLPSGERLFGTPLAVTEQPMTVPDLVVVQLPVVSDPYEIATMISMASGKVRPFPRIIVACAVAVQGAEAATNEALAEFNLPAVEVFYLAQMAEGASELRDKLYDVLDNRQLKIGPLIPIWIAERMWGPMPEHLKEKRRRKQRVSEVPD